MPICIQWYLIMALICVSLIARDAKHFFHMHSTLFNEMSLHVSCPFSNCIICFYCSVLGVLDVCFVRHVCKYSLLLCSLSFHPLSKIFHRAKVSFWWSQIYWFFTFMDCTFGIMSTNSSPSLGSPQISPMLFSKSLTVLHCIVKSITYFELILCKLFKV